MTTLRTLVFKALSLAPGISNPLWRAYYRARRFDSHKAYGLTGDRTTVFSEIYRSNLWTSEESRSGGGSTIAATRYVRRELPRLLKRLGAKSLLDAPCGDFHWMKTVDLGDTDYVGADLVPELIDELQARFASEHRQFRVLDIVSGPVPRADVWLCREVLMHIPIADALAVLRNFVASGSTYFLATTFDLTTHNADLEGVGFRPLNLQISPIDLPAPLYSFDDFVAPMQPRKMAIWNSEQISNALSLKPA